MKFLSAAMTDAGPRPANEDAVRIWASPDGSLMVAVADGLGGMGGGGAASHLAIQTLEDCLRGEATPEEMRAGAYAAHERIIQEQLTASDLRHMATTLTACCLFGSTMTGVHCGDTRAALARGSGIKRLTQDHSEGERLFQAGKLTKEELRDYPRQNILESALGVPNGLRLDTFSFDLLPGDKVLLTTDGVHELVPLREMRAIAAENASPDSFVEKMFELVKTRTPRDNFTVACVFVS